MKKFPYQIYCDMDGVLVDFLAGAIKKMNQTINDKDHPLHEIAENVKAEIGSNTIELAHLTKGHPRCVDCARDYMRPLLEDDEKFWADLPWMPEGKSIWEAIKDYNPIILTAPMDQNGYTASIKGKEKWIKRHLGLGINRRVIYSHDKYEYANKGGEPTVLIDDYDKNVRLFKEHGGITIHHLGDLSKTLKSLEDLKNVHSNRTSNRSRTQTTGTRS